MTDTSKTPSNPFSATPALSPEALGAVRSVAEYEIEREYGADNRKESLVAGALAIAAIEMDVVKAFVEANGSLNGLRQYSGVVLRMAVRRELDARLCQCPEVISHGGKCQGHTEADVPTVDGLKLCGMCYSARA